MTTSRNASYIERDWQSLRTVDHRSSTSSSKSTDGHHTARSIRHLMNASASKASTRNIKQNNSVVHIQGVWPQNECQNATRQRVRTQRKASTSTMSALLWTLVPYITISSHAQTFDMSTDVFYMQSAARSDKKLLSWMPDTHMCIDYNHVSVSVLDTMHLFARLDCIMTHSRGCVRCAARLISKVARTERSRQNLVEHWWRVSEWRESCGAQLFQSLGQLMPSDEAVTDRVTVLK